MSDVPSGEMRRSLTLTGITVNAMALIAPGAFLWTTFQIQASQKGGTTATDMWTGLLFALVLALLTAYSYSELARIYPDAGAGSSYYFAEAALLDREGPKMRAFARTAKLTVGWISHLYYWLYPSIMVGFMGILFGYLYSAIFHHTLTYIPQAIGCVALALVCGYIAFRGISGSTMTAIIINVVQITCLVAVSFLFIAYRLGHGHEIYAFANAGKVVIPHSFIHIIYQSTIAILLLVGFESVTALGSEALRPEKDIKKGVLLSLIIQGGICYLFEYFAANFVVSTTTTANPAITLPPGTNPLGGFSTAALDPAPIGTAVKNVAASTLHAGTAVSLIVAATVLIALLGTTLACLNTGVRVTYAMAKDKEMPGLLSPTPWPLRDAPWRDPRTYADIGSHRRLLRYAVQRRQHHPDHARLEHRYIPGLRDDLYRRRRRVRGTSRQASAEAHGDSRAGGAHEPGRVVRGRVSGDHGGWRHLERHLQGPRARRVVDRARYCLGGAEPEQA